jgi:uncharacterized membrane protein
MNTHSLPAGSLTPSWGVPMLRPLHWLWRGAADMRHSLGTSLIYGLIVTAIGALILALGNHPSFIAATITGFLLVGPALGTGLCELSRRREQGEAMGFEASLSPLARRRSALLGLASVLVALSAVWFLLSTLLLQGVFGAQVPVTFGALWGDAMAQASSEQLIAYVASGGALAALVFVLSVVAVPLIIDRESTTTGEAMSASLSACMQNLPAAIVWAALITALVAVGFATMLIGMLVIFPLLGHATWHAYRDLSR